MGLATYSDLKASVADWLHREDLSAAITDFVTLAEARINNELFCQQQITSTTLTTTAGVATVALPTDWLRLVRLAVSGQYNALDFQSPTQFASMYAGTTTGIPVHYTIEDDSLVLGPTPSDAYSIALTYYAAVPALSDSATTNWLLTKWPNVYLFGALCESAPYTGDDSRLQMWEARFQQALNAARKFDQAARFSGAVPQVAVR